MKKLSDNLDERHNDAMAKYHSRYNNALYRAATAYMPELPAPAPTRLLNRAYRLQDAAMAVCGDPYNRIDPAVKWTKEEQAFLDLFV